MSDLGIPSIEEILRKGIDRVVEKSNVSNLSNLIEKSSLSEVIVEIESTAHKIYLEEEMEAVNNLLKNRGIPAREANLASEVFIKEDLVTRLANTRRVRGGLTSERILRVVLASLGIPCEKGRIKAKGYRPDIAVPSNEALRKSPSKAVAIAVKRTLRERWAEDIDVFSSFKNGKFVLLLPDPDFNESKAGDMVNRGMKKVYINDGLYEQNKSFMTDEFRKHSQLPSDILEVIGTTQKKLA